MRESLKRRSGVSELWYCIWTKPQGQNEYSQKGCSKEKKAKTPYTFNNTRDSSYTNEALKDRTGVFDHWDFPERNQTNTGENPYSGMSGGQPNQGGGFFSMPDLSFSQNPPYNQTEGYYSAGNPGRSPSFMPDAGSTSVSTVYSDDKAHLTDGQAWGGAGQNIGTVNQSDWDAWMLQNMNANPVQESSRDSWPGTETRKGKDVKKPGSISCLTVAIVLLTCILIIEIFVLAAIVVKKRSLLSKTTESTGYGADLIIEDEEVPFCFTIEGLKLNGGFDMYGTGPA